jgi:hypothetical protein
VQEEELTPAAQLASRGQRRMRVQGETSMGSPCRILQPKDEGRQTAAPLHLSRYAAFFAFLGTGLASFLAFALAANSCFTLRVIASVSTL